MSDVQPDQPASESPGPTRTWWHPLLVALVGGLFPLWILETDRLAFTSNTVLAFFSHAFLEQPKRIIEQWQDTGHAAILNFILQQIRQFRNMGDAFTMQHKDTQLMDATWEDVEDLVMSLAPTEKRLEGLSPEERLEGLSPEKRLEGLSPEERLEGLSPEERLEGLGPDELQRLHELLQKRLPSEQQGNGSS